MIELKQLQYFVECAKTGSFSKAAEQLYTTQPSVSRVIRSLEEEVGYQLFERYTKGIGLTPEGETIFKMAEKVLENVQRMEKMEPVKRVEILHISTNPSSWFADTFLEYYHLHKEEPVHYQINSLSTQEIVQRIQNRSDDVGFVYVMKNQLPAFQYFLSRNYVEFEVLGSSEIMLHPGKAHAYWENPEIDLSFDKLRMVQRFQDEYSPDNYWDIQDANGNSAASAETVVLTNSDYIMDRLLRTSDLVNLSGAYLGGGDRGVTIHTGDGNQILFGCICRKGESVPESIRTFIDFVRKRLDRTAEA